MIISKGISSGYLGPLVSTSINYSTNWETSGIIGNASSSDISSVLSEACGKNISFDGVHAGGKGLTDIQCINSSIGEFKERIMGAYSFWKEKDHFIFSTYNEMILDGINAINPIDFQLFSDEQYSNKNFPYTRFTNESKVNWICGERLVSKEKIYVPAQLILLFYFLLKDEDRIGYSTSGGLSFHTSKKEAIRGSINELLERDSLDTSWFFDIKPKKILINDSFPLYDEIQSLPQKIDFYKYESYIPEFNTIVSASFNNDLKKYSYLSGGGADLDITSALIKSYTEYGQAEKSLRYMTHLSKRNQSEYFKRFIDVPEDANPKEVDDFFKTIFYYGHKKNRVIVKNHFSNKNHLYLKDLDNQNEQYKYDDSYNKLINILSKNNLDPIMFDFSSSFDCSDSFLFKSISENLTFASSPSREFFGNKRYKSFIKKGYKLVDDYPLPFP